MANNKKTNKKSNTKVNSKPNTKPNTESNTKKGMESKPGKTMVNHEISPKKKEEKKQGKKKYLLLLLLLIAVTVGTAFAVGYVLIFNRDNMAQEDITPDFAPDIDENAESLDDDGGGKLEQPKGGGAVNITFTKDVVVDLSSKKVDFNFSNPSRSNQDMVIQIVIRDKVVMQTGTLAPGNQIKTAKLLDSATLHPGTYNGKFKVLYYYKDTGERAVVDTDIPIAIKVKA